MNSKKKKGPSHLPQIFREANTFLNYLMQKPNYNLTMNMSWWEMAGS